VSAARHAYGVAGVAVANERPSVTAGNVLPLMILVIGLAVATIWFVALPALDKPPRAGRSCEVFVLESGSTRCVPNPMPGSSVVPQKPKPSSRAKH
jgi:hypothetical protein